jgi:hypothetical protein
MGTAQIVASGLGTDVIRLIATYQFIVRNARCVPRNLPLRPIFLAERSLGNMTERCIHREDVMPTSTPGIFEVLITDNE